MRLLRCVLCVVIIRLPKHIYVSTFQVNCISMHTVNPAKYSSIAATPSLASSPPYIFPPTTLWPSIVACQLSPTCTLSSSNGFATPAHEMEYMSNYNTRVRVQVCATIAAQENG